MQRGSKTDFHRAYTLIDSSYLRSDAGRSAAKQSPPCLFNSNVCELRSQRSPVLIFFILLGFKEVNSQ